MPLKFFSYSRSFNSNQGSSASKADAIQVFTPAVNELVDATKERHIYQVSYLLSLIVLLRATYLRFTNLCLRFDSKQGWIQPLILGGGGAAEIYFHSRRSISVALSKYVSAVFGILISIHVVNTDVFV